MPKNRRRHEAEGGDWDAMSITRIGEAPKLSGDRCEQTNTPCPNGCKNLAGRIVMMLRKEGDFSGREFCKGCNEEYMVR